MSTEISSDYRVLELLQALKEGVVEVDFVRLKLTELAGDKVDLIHYSDGRYDILVN